jgi:eukaryotic-like serine/threonine-protein kinase
MSWLRVAAAILFVPAPLVAATNAKPERIITVPPGADVQFTAISPKGDFIAGACKDGQVRVWTLPGGELRQAFSLQDQHVSSMTFSDDGTLLAVGGNRGAVKIWTIPSGTLKHDIKVGENVNALAISPNKTLLALARQEHPAQLWDLDVRRIITELPAKFSGSLALAFSPDGQRLASADADTAIRIYEASTGAIRATANDLLLETFAITFSADSKNLYAGGADKTISVIDAGSGKIQSSFPKQSLVVGELHRSPDGKFLIALYFDEKSFRNPAPAIVWDIAGQSIQTNFSESNVTPNGSGFSKNGHVLITNSTGPQLQIWSVR